MDLKELFDSEEAQPQTLTLFIPNKDRNGNEIPDIEDWVHKARILLTIIGEGATALPPADGTWLKNKSATLETISKDDVTWEKTVMIFTYIDIDDEEKFVACFQKLKSLLIDFGKTTNQDCVVFEFNHKMYKLRKFVP